MNIHLKDNDYSLQILAVWRLWNSSCSSSLFIYV